MYIKKDVKQIRTKNAYTIIVVGESRNGYSEAKALNTICSYSRENAIHKKQNATQHIVILTFALITTTHSATAAAATVRMPFFFGNQCIALAKTFELFVKRIHIGATSNCGLPKLRVFWVAHCEFFRFFHNLSKVVGIIIGIKKKF